MQQKSTKRQHTATNHLKDLFLAHLCACRARQQSQGRCDHSRFQTLKEKDKHQSQEKKSMTGKGGNGKGRKRREGEEEDQWRENRNKRRERKTGRKQRNAWQVRKKRTHLLFRWQQDFSFEPRKQDPEEHAFHFFLHRSTSQQNE